MYQWLVPVQAGKWLCSAPCRPQGLLLTVALWFPTWGFQGYLNLGTPDKSKGRKNMAGLTRFQEPGLEVALITSAHLPFFQNVPVCALKTCSIWWGQISVWTKSRGGTGVMQCFFLPDIPHGYHWKLPQHWAAQRKRTLTQKHSASCYMDYSHV